MPLDHKCLVQEIASCMLDSFSTEKVNQWMRNGLGSKGSLTNFAMFFLECMASLASSCKACSTFRFIWQGELCEPLACLVMRLGKVSRSLLHFFVQYAGDEYLERSMKRVYTDETLWWASEVADMIKKGAGALVNVDRMADLKVALAADPSTMTLASLKSAAELFEKVRSSTRSQLLSGITASYCEPRIV